MEGLNMNLYSMTNFVKLMYNCFIFVCENPGLGGGGGNSLRVNIAVLSITILQANILFNENVLSRFLTEKP